MRYYLSLCLIFCFFSASAQFNVSVGYTIGRVSSDGLDRVLERFNESRPWLFDPMEKKSWLNGYNIGARYKFDRVAFDFKWENQINRSSASGVDPDTDNDFEQTLFFKLSSFGIGIESFLSEKISFHGNFEFNKFRVRTELTDLSDRVEIFSNWTTGSTFSVGYNFIGNSLVHVSIRPYLTVRWEPHSLNDLDRELNPLAPATGRIEEEFLNFGLKVIFYNGIWN